MGYRSAVAPHERNGKYSPRKWWSERNVSDITRFETEITVYSSIKEQDGMVGEE